MNALFCLHSLSSFGSLGTAIAHAAPRYWYVGQCPRSGEELKLPRTELAEKVAHGLMQMLAAEAKYSQEGKMYGVLLVETPRGELQVLKAFSGLLQGQLNVAGWVPPISGRDRVMLQERQTLDELDTLKQELLTLMQLTIRQDYKTLVQEFEQQLRQLSVHHHQRKQARQQQRQRYLESLQGEALATCLMQLDDQSRWDGIERRRLKQQRDLALHPLKQAIDQADARIRDLKQQRKTLSQRLQTQMHTVYSLTNFAGEVGSLRQLMATGALPTGTGECCAPKLLHYAASHALQPIAMAEFWWGPASAKGDKVQGEFYGACAERCQPLMGFLLSGLPTPNLAQPDISLPILYEDEWLIAVNKPPGLLSVPGRSIDRQDSVLSRLRQRLPDGTDLVTVHRLDQDTSGILLLARDLQSYRQLSQQFQQRRVHKVYEAIVSGKVTAMEGVIDLPLWADPTDRPRQKVNWQYGKPSVTRFQVMGHAQGYTRMALTPITGRTHQLRVHAADVRGLGIPILGDRLYGTASDRLYLHARELSIQHPHAKQMLCLKVDPLF